MTLLSLSRHESFPRVSSFLLRMASHVTLALSVMSSCLHLTEVKAGLSGMSYLYVKDAYTIKPAFRKEM